MIRRIRKPAPDQAQRDAAVTERDRNILIDAGAGTGKTTILVDRLVELVAPSSARRAIPDQSESAADHLYAEGSRWTCGYALGSGCSVNSQTGLQAPDERPNSATRLPGWTPRTWDNTQLRGPSVAAAAG